jgi:hypothetical protein
LTGEQILNLQQVVRSVNVGEHIFSFVAGRRAGGERGPRNPAYPNLLGELLPLGSWSACLSKSDRWRQGERSCTAAFM